MSKGLTKLWLRAFCVGCLMAGWVFLVIAAVSAGHTELFLRHSAITTGTVLANVPVDGQGSGAAFAPEFRYTASDGQSYTVTSGNSSAPPAFAVGEQVAVRYEAGQPAEARIDSFWQVWGLAMGLGVGGAACLLAGTILLMAFRRRKRRELAAAA